MSTKTVIFLALLGLIPLSFLAEWLNWSPLMLFVLSGLAILPLARWMGQATEEIAVVVGPSLGGLLNATFGNATELIIALVALRGGLVEVVKASLTGSVIGNLLLVMGLSMLLGGLRYKEQTFQPLVARVNASTMNLAVIAMLVPTAVNFTSPGLDEATIQTLSIGVAIVLILVYGLTLLFSMKTHSYLCEIKEADQEDGENHDPRLPLGAWVGVLLVSTLFVALESEMLVNSLEVATEQLGWSQLFIGVILLPVIGNAAEHTTAVTVAMKNKMELSLAVAVGSSLQIALFVAPVLVLVGWFLGQPMDLNFNPFELIAVLVAVAIANSISSDGQSNWLEGTLLLATYIILALAFFFHPA